LAHLAAQPHAARRRAAPYTAPASHARASARASERFTYSRLLEAAILLAVRASRASSSIFILLLFSAARDVRSREIERTLGKNSIPLACNQLYEAHDVKLDDRI